MSLARAAAVPSVIAAFLTPSPAQAKAANPRPTVVPALQSWTGGTGSYTLPPVTTRYLRVLSLFRPEVSRA